MEQQLAAHKLGFFRIPAVNGSEVRAQQDPYWSDPRRSHLGAAETGCLLSHANTWRLIAQANSEFALVLEDDIHLSDDFGDFIRSISLNPKECCVHKLETFGANVTLARHSMYTARQRRAYKLETHHGGSGAYIVSKAVATHLLNSLDLFDQAMDIELFDPERRKIQNLTILQWVPAPCIQDFLLGESNFKKNFVSNIARDRSDVRIYAAKRFQKYKELIKSRFRRLYTKVYSISLLPSGRMRRRIDFG